MLNFKGVFAILITMTFTMCGPFLCELCGERWRPVCSKRGITYYNKCHAICYLDFNYIEGECMKKCECLDEWKPVCGVNGKTYENTCTAICNNVEVDFLEAC